MICMISFLSVNRFILNALHCFEEIDVGGEGDSGSPANESVLLEAIRAKRDWQR